MLDSLLERIPPGWRWPSFREARALLLAGVRPAPCLVAAWEERELPIFVAWLALRALMSQILSKPARGRDVAEFLSRSVS
jgi:hypothetical protein